MKVAVHDLYMYAEVDGWFLTVRVLCLFFSFSLFALKVRVCGYFRMHSIGFISPGMPGADVNMTLSQIHCILTAICIVIR